jgi:hypothetical protein
MAKAEDEITLTSEQEAIVSAFLKKYPEASRFTAVKFCFGRKFELNRIFPLYEEYRKVVKERNLENLSASSVLHELRTQKMYIPGTRDRKGSALFVVKASEHVIGQFPPESTIRLAYYLGECVTASLKTQRNGVTLIIDLTGTEWANFDANFMSEIIGFFQNHIPAAVKNILIWRAPWWIRTAIKIVSPFLKEKMRKRIKLCDNLHALLEFVDEADLPEEFGGTFEYDHEYFIRRQLSKTNSDDLFASLAGDESENVEFAGSSRVLQMGTAECAISAEAEEILQSERDNLILEVEGEILQFTENQEDLYPVPVYDLMQNRIYRMTLDVTVDFRSLKNGRRVVCDPISEAWEEARLIPDDEKRMQMMKEAIMKYNDGINDNNNNNVSSIHQIESS